MEITEKWLGEIGGWQAMKAARMLLAAGKVQVTEQTGECIRGHVGGEKSRLSSGLRIQSKSDVENLCTCMMARRTGQICDHALAVALASLHPALATAAATTTVSKPGLAPNHPETERHSVESLPPTTAPGQLSLFLPETLFHPRPVGGKSSATAFLKLEAGPGECSKLAAWLKSRGAPLQNTPLSLPPAELGSLLQAAAEHPRIFIGKPGAGMHRSLAVSATEIRPLVRVQMLPERETAGSWISFQLAETPAPQLLATLPPSDQTWLLHAGSSTIHPWRSGSGRAGEIGQITQELLVDFRPGRGVRRPLKWLVSNLPELEEIFQVELENELSNRYKVVPAKSHYRITLSGSLQEVQLRVLASFAESEWSITSNKDPFPIEDKSIPGVFYARNRNAEKALFEQLGSFGFALNGATGDFELRGKREVLRFFSSNQEKLTSYYNVTISDNWRKATSHLLRIAPVLASRDVHSKQDTTTSSGIDWMTMEFAYEAPNGFQLSRAETLRLIRSGQNTVKGKDGRQYVLDVERCEEFEEALQDVPVQLTPGGMRLSAAHADYFLPFASRAALTQTQDDPLDESVWRVRLGHLGQVLRPYQVEGVAWLAQRLEAGQGALLGDDMGLGKTLQSIAVIRWMLQKPTEKQQALIVCPKSLIPNWEAEFKRFAPELRVLPIQGARRQEQFAIIDDYDVLITSYPLISRDLALYQTRQFAIGVFDEASFLRNPDTDTAGAARSLPLRTRLALSGTPVENGVRDLWSIFQILLPGYLGTRQTFSERFEKPLQQPSTPVAVSAASRLRRLIRPFFLRRTKGEVLKDLPEKIEQVFWCEMSAPQAEIYRRILEEGREEIRAARRRSGQNGARMTMLTVLLRLRQVCCDVSLAGLPEEKVAGLDLNERSGKWSALDERLDEALAGGGKVLLFSQFVTYLKACRAHLDGRQIGYAYLDGSTQDRAAQVQAFQTDAQKQVFLISLKAGGYGLNLTQADQVFLMDPWWNPAVEAQAIDRAHRFGQSRVVNAYRFVMRGTVEERVLALQDKKRGLISATIEERAPMMEGLTDSDLESLLNA